MFDLVQLDPMWNYVVRSRKGLSRSAENHYPTVTVEVQKTFPIPDLFNRNCAVFMWATYPNLPQAFDLGAAYGLTYKTVAFTWVKLNKLWYSNFMRQLKKTGSVDEALAWYERHAYFMGNGYYTRANPELCLLFTKGKPLKRLDLGVPNLIVSPIGAHSAKPDEASNRMVRLFGDRPRVEIYARKYRPGWTSLGLDLDGMSVTESIPKLLQNSSLTN
jgi:N6-adenosine-specific RNA methylase IME4